MANFKFRRPNNIGPENSNITNLPLSFFHPSPSSSRVIRTCPPWRILCSYVCHLIFNFLGFVTCLGHYLMIVTVFGLPGPPWWAKRPCTLQKSIIIFFCWYVIASLVSSSMYCVHHRMLLCSIVYHITALYIIVYHRISLYIIVYHCVSLCIIVYHCVSLCIIGLVGVSQYSLFFLTNETLRIPICL